MRHRPCDGVLRRWGSLRNGLSYRLAAVRLGGSRERIGAGFVAFFNPGTKCCRPWRRCELCAESCSRSASFHRGRTRRCGRRKLRANSLRPAPRGPGRMHFHDCGMYARRKNWPLQGVIVRLRHARIHAEDCATCETNEGLLDRIECELELAGPLSTEQRSKLLEISEKCPVHRTLQSRIEIQSSLLQATIPQQ